MHQEYYTQKLQILILTTSQFEFTVQEYYNANIDFSELLFEIYFCIHSLFEIFIESAVEYKRLRSSRIQFFRIISKSDQRDIR